MQAMELLRPGATVDSAKVRWRQLAAPRPGDVPAPTPRSGHVAVPVRSEQWATEFVVIYGGLSDRKEFLGDCVVLETAEGQWMRPVQEGGLSPGPRAFHAACAVGSRVYLFGGSWSPRNRYQPDLWCLDTDDWQWSLVETEKAPQPRDFPTLVHLGGNLVVLYGGYSGAKFMSDIHVLDVTTGVWQEVAAEGLGAQQPAPRSGHAATAVAQRLAVLGGETSSNTMLSDFWTLRGLQGDGPVRWTKLNFKGQSPSARGAHAVADVGSKLVVYGGHGEEGFIQRKSVYYGDIYILDREAEPGPVWPRVDVKGAPEVPEGRAYHTLTPVHGKRALMFGGCNGTMRATFGDAWWLVFEGSPYWDDQARPIPPPSEQPALSSGAAAAAQQQTAVAPATRATPAPAAASASPESEPLPAANKDSGVADLWAQVLGEPPQQPAPDRLESPVAQLGRRELGKQGHEGATAPEGSTEAYADAARRFLSKAQPNELKLGDIEALFADYRALSSQALSASAMTGSDDSLRRSILDSTAHRFMHFRLDQLRMSDIPFLLDEYKNLIMVVSGGP